jgi:hypothetical protein
MSDEMNYYVGEGDLELLGLAAAFAARYQVRRKGASVALTGFPQSDTNAVGLVLTGIEKAVTLAFDDVPQVWITVSATPSVIRQLQKLTSAGLPEALEESDRVDRERREELGE